MVSNLVVFYLIQSEKILESLGPFLPNSAMSHSQVSPDKKFCTVKAYPNDPLKAAIPMATWKCSHS